MRLRPFLIVAAISFVAYSVWRKSHPSAPAAQPLAPPPPAILSEPLPVIDAAEQAKIVKSTEDLDPDVRWEAAVLLDKMGSPRSKPIIFNMLHEDLEPKIRILAAGLLSNRREGDVLEALKDALHDRDAEVRIAALRALEKIGDYSVAAAIATGPVKDTEESVRLQALKTLNSLQDKRQVEVEAAKRLYEQQKAQSAQPR